MLLFYILGICFAVNSSHIALVEQVSCSRYDENAEPTEQSAKLWPISQISSDKKDEQIVRLEVIKQKILKKLGLKNAPQVDKQVSNKIASMFCF